MKKTNSSYIMAIALIASAIGVESVVASSKTNATESYSIETEKKITLANDSVVTDNRNLKIENLVFLSEPMDGADIGTYLKNNIKYPGKAIEDGIEGYVKVFCTVETSGVVSNVFAIEGTNDDLSREVTKALRSARFKPVMQNGHPARYNLIIPVNFELIR